MKKILGIRAGSLAIVVAAILALGATPVLAFHDSTGPAAGVSSDSDCASCHGMQHSRRFVPVDGAWLMHHETLNH